MNPVAPASSTSVVQLAAGAPSLTAANSSKAAVQPAVGPLEPLRQDSTSHASGPEGSQKLADAGRMHQVLLSLMKVNSDIEGQGLLKQIA